MTFIAPSTELDISRVGAKAHHLARLRAGEPGRPDLTLRHIHVPAFFTITADAYRVAIREAGLSDASSETLHRALPEIELPAGLADNIARARRFTFDDGALLAVRSSVIGEDGDEASFAGLHESFLYIRTQDELLGALRRVWASAHSPRAVAYRRQRAWAEVEVDVAVLVQRMVDAERSGVLFTADPSTGDVHRHVISALYGAGEGLVSRGLAADTFTIDKEDGELESRVESKEVKLVQDLAAGGLRSMPVATHLREKPCLEEADLRLLAELGERIERFFGSPQDIEFSFDPRGRLFILQSRKITTVEERGPAAGHRRLWDNSNIVESYSGVTTPMTFSFIQHAYSHVYHCFSEVMGIAPKAVRANRNLFSNMLGLFRGRVFYNLENWYRLVRLFPGYDLNRGFMESMMGVREQAGGDSEDQQSFLARLKGAPALLRLIGRSLGHFMRIKTHVSRFEKNFDDAFGDWSKLDMDAMSPHELQALFRDMEEKLLWRWHAPIINDFFVMLFYGLLKRLCVNWCGDASGTLQNDLVCGEGGIISTEPTRRLLEIARDAHANSELRRFLVEESPEDLFEILKGETRFQDFQRQIDEYLEQYGFRCVDELKLEEPSLQESPAFLFHMLGNYLRRDEPMDPRASFEREQRVRLEAEARARKSLGPLRHWIFQRVLKAARLGVKNRENLRFARTKVYGLVRRLLRAMGGHFVREGLIDDVSDIFYLKLDEVWSFLDGTAVTTNLRALVGMRRRQFDAWKAMEEPADRFSTYGLPYHRNLFRGRPKSAGEPQDGDLRGVGCCPGQVSGPVRVMHSPREASLDGEILVAERTDPGWVPLYPSISGLLIERGSILSHSAIVAREMGLPTIVGIEGLTSRLEDGDFVHMDGSTGTVQLETAESHTQSQALGDDSRKPEVHHEAA